MAPRRERNCSRLIHTSLLAIRIFPVAEACIPIVEKSKVLQILGVFLVSSHAGRQVFSIARLDFFLTLMKWSLGAK